MLLGELNAVRWNDWKMPHEAEMGYLRWYADNMWLFVPIQQKIGEFRASESAGRRASIEVRVSA